MFRGAHGHRSPGWTGQVPWKHPRRYADSEQSVDGGWRLIGPDEPGEKSRLECDLCQFLQGALRAQGLCFPAAFSSDLTLRPPSSSP